MELNFVIFSVKKLNKSLIAELAQTDSTLAKINRQIEQTMNELVKKEIVFQGKD